MSEGFIYLIRRNKTNVKILHRVNVDGRIANPNPFNLIVDPIIAKGVAETIKTNILNWESYAENGTVEEILSRWRNAGAKIPISKYHPIIKKQTNPTPISQNHNLGKLPN